MLVPLSGVNSKCWEIPYPLATDVVSHLAPERTTRHSEVL